MLASRGPKSLRRAAACLAVAATAAGCGGAREGREAPNLVLPDVKGALVDLRGLRSGPVLVGFWTTWAVPSRLALGQWGRLQRTYGKRGFKVLAVAAGEDAGAVAKVLKQVPPGVTVLMGTGEATAAWYGRGDMVLPTAWLLDGRGRVLKRFAGYRRAEEFAPTIERELGRGGQWTSSQEGS